MIGRRFTMPGCRTLYEVVMMHYYTRSLSCAWWVVELRWNSDMLDYCFAPTCWYWWGSPEFHKFHFSSAGERLRQVTTSSCSDLLHPAGSNSTPTRQQKQDHSVYWILQVLWCHTLFFCYGNMMWWSELVCSGQWSWYCWAPEQGLEPSINQKDVPKEPEVILD